MAIRATIQSEVLGLRRSCAAPSTDNRDRPRPARVARLEGARLRAEPTASTRSPAPAPGPGTFGGGHNFPGAGVPFGMVQWSPDTTPADRDQRAGYDYRDHHLRGFSLTHLSGAGCSLYGDFPFVPTTEPLLSSPARPGSGLLDGSLQPGFSHAAEQARPGYYSVRLKPVHGPGIETELTATTRTGVGRFTFGANPHSSVLINAGGSAQADDLAEVQIHPLRREIDGAASSGLFCGQRPRYRVYVAAVFDRPFEAYGTWEGSRLGPARPKRARRRRRKSIRTTTAPGGRLRDLRHPPQPAGAGPRRPLLRQRRGRPRQPRGRKREVQLRRGRQRRGGQLEPLARPDPRLRRPDRACSTPSTPRSTTPSSRRARSATSAAPIWAWTDWSTGRATASSTPTSPAGTSTAREIQLLSILAPQAGQPTMARHCSPTPNRAAACRAGPTRTARA